ncbi:alpha/beta fold hydrolase [Pendulispora albinea]|uniref:Alpha/beta fold hydrolase n=1 Tax=Pendulispora albinea TaxID=2741071 RepID=A0ABZ2M9K3_9BACT
MTTSNQHENAMLAKALELVNASSAKLERMRARERSPIAITGRALRFPGGCTSPAALWDLLARGGDATEETPADRWNGRAYHASSGITPGKSITRRGGFVHRVREFDAGFFGISAREARELDPQQRMLLEVTWEALEDALLPPSQLRGTATGVFVGICSSDYNALALRLPLDKLTGYAGTGMGRSPSAGRISYVLGLKGPAFAVDTACSSSLVALHVAVQSLRREECERAIVAGVNLILEPSGHIAFSQAGMLSPDGRCKTFSHAADGYSRAEGVGVLILERRDVLAPSGRAPLAWVRGTALNQDGAAGGLTVPSGPAQQEVIRAALASGGLDARDVSYIEAHGTGTPLGDVIEVNAIASVFRATHDASRPLTLGSIKANVGHMEAAAGVGSLIKLVEQLVRRQIPPAPSFGPLNARIPWSDLPVRVPHAGAPWGAGGEVLYGGVNSFGFSGTNGHAVLCSTTDADAPAPAPQAWIPHILPISARTGAALERMRERYADFAGATHEAPADLCASAQRGREAMQERMCAIGADRARLSEMLRSGEGLVRPRTEGPARPAMAWLFSGQGAQRARMGEALYARLPVFRSALDRCAEWLRGNAGVDLPAILFGAAPPEAIHQTANAQPALFAYEWSLAQQWLDWGLTPDYVAGHSVGELAAACVADVFSVEDGLRLIAARGALMQALPGGGKMLAVQAALDVVSDQVAEHARGISVAAINAPEQVVLSGDGEALERVAKVLESRGVRHTWMRVSHAFHSPRMRPMLDAFERVANQITYRAPRFPLVSNVTGEVADRAVASARYWRDHVMATVQFARSMQTLDRKGCRVFLEIGPAPVLSGLGRHNVPRADVAWAASARGGGELEALERCLATLWVERLGVAWSKVHAGAPVPRVELPKYAFERSVYWLPEAGPVIASGRASEHPLLGTRLETPALGSTIVHEGALDPVGSPYLSDHRVFEQAIFPATGYAELLLEAGCAAGLASPALTALEIERPLRIADDEPSRFQVVFGGAEGAAQCQVLTPVSQDGGIEWVLLCRGQVHASTSEPADARKPASPVRKELPALTGTSVDIAALRALNARKGLEHRDRFWALVHAVREDRRAVGRLELHADLREQAAAHRIHPVLLDGCFQVAMCLTEDAADLILPVGIDTLRVHHPGAAGGICEVVLEERVGDAVYRIALALYAEDGTLLAEAQGVTARRTTREAMRRTLGAAVPQVFYARDLVTTSRMETPAAPVTAEASAAPGTTEASAAPGTAEASAAPVAAEASAAPVTAEASAARGTTEASAAPITAEASAARGTTEASAAPGTAGAEASAAPVTAEASAARDSVPWLLVAPPSPFRDQVDAQIRAVYAGSDVLPLDPTAPLADAVQRAANGIPDVPGAIQVVYLAASAPNLAEAANATAAHLRALRDLLVELTSKSAGRDIRLSIVSGADDPAGSAALRAWVDSAARELPQLTGRLIALDGAGSRAPVPEANIASLGRDLASDRSAHEVWLTHGERLEPRWRALPAPQADPARAISAAASYLITGGLGALGLACAERLIRLGARHLVLAHRSTPTAEALAAVERFTGLGTEITLARIDVAQPSDVARLFANLAASPSKLQGIVHLAGRLHDGLLHTQDDIALDDVFDPKARGALLLHEHARAFDLRFFVLFSSIGAAFGSPAQTCYAAANAFCDGLVALRRRQGLPGLSIQWGPWADIGMAAQLDLEQRTRMQRAGLRYLSPQTALDAFEALLFGDTPAHVLVADIAWDVAAEQWLLPGQRASGSGLSSRSANASLDSPALRALAETSPEDRPQALRAFLDLEVLRALGEAPDKKLDPNASLAQLGLDSLGAVDLTNRLARVLKIKLPRRLELDQVSIGALAKALLEQPIAWDTLRTDSASPTPAQTTPTPSNPAESPPAPNATSEPAPASDETVDQGGHEQTWQGHQIRLGGLRWGSAETARTVLLHGIRSHAGVWEQVAHRVHTRGHDVIAPDMRGHGRSEHAAPGHFLDVMDMLRDLEALLGGRGDEPVVLGAHSFGCSIAVLYAALSPNRVRGLVLAEPVIPLLYQPPVDVALLRSAIDVVRAPQRVPAHPVMAELETAIELTQHEYPALSRAACERLTRRVLATSPRGHRWTWDPALREFDRYGALFTHASELLGWLAHLHAPVHVFVGAESPYRTRADAEKLCEALPRGAIHALPGTHHVHVEHPDPIAERLLELLAQREETFLQSQPAA